MRPQDVAILLKIVALGNKEWQLILLSNSMKISISEVSESLNRSRVAGLIDESKKRVNRQNLLEFLEYGVKYVFPQQPGSIVRGIPTAHSHTFLQSSIISEVKYVWPDNTALDLGLKIEPFYPKQVQAVQEDETYYKLLALVDVIRVGKVREINLARKELKQMLLYGTSH